MTNDQQSEFNQSGGAIPQRASEMPPASVEIPVSRVRAMSRAVALGAPAFALGLIVVLALRGLRFTGGGLSNRLVDYCWAALLFPLVPLTLYLAAISIRQLLLSVWPFRLGIVFSPRSLQIRLGPFGRREYDASELTVRYPFEIPEAAEGGSFEALLPIEEQLSTFVPSILERDSKRCLGRRIVRFSSLNEEEIAATAREVVAHWQAMASRQGSGSSRPSADA